MKKSTASLCCWTVLLSYSTTLGNVMFGTKSGYDNGGADPICFFSRWNTPANDNSDNAVLPTTNRFVVLNEEFYTMAGHAQLLPKCYTDSRFVIVSADPDFDRVMYTGQNYVFRLSLELSLEQINSKINITALNDTIAVHFRILMCDAIKEGFCNPVVDTRAVEATLDESETDLHPQGASTAMIDDSLFSYTEGNPLLGIDTGNIIFSRWIAWKSKALEKGSDKYMASVSITLQLPESARRGIFFFIGHAVTTFRVGDEYNRLDIADSIPNNVVEVRHAPIILEISNATIIGISVMIGSFGSVALAMFVFVVVHREHPVIKLSQSSLLAAISACCFVSIVGSFTFIPTHGIFCRLSGPLVLIPATLIGAILVGRVWRVYATIYAALKMGREMKKLNNVSFEKCGIGEYIVNTLNFLASLPFMFIKQKKVTSFRRIVSVMETYGLIVILSLPQIFLQTFGAIFYTSGLVVTLNETEDIGRKSCPHDANWIVYLGMIFVGILYLVAVIVSWVARDLPSAFNEKQLVCQAASISSCATFLALTLRAITDQPTTHPEILVFLQVVLSFGVSLSILFLFVWPKIRRVMSGEQIIITNILANRFETVSKSMRSSQEESCNSTDMNETSEISKKKIIIISEGDPVPNSVEARVLTFHDFLGIILNYCSEGKPLSATMWKQLQADVAKLKDEVDRVEFGSEEDTEPIEETRKQS